MKNALRTLLFTLFLFAAFSTGALASVEIKADSAEQLYLPENSSEIECNFKPEVTGYYRVLLLDESDS